MITLLDYTSGTRKVMATINVVNGQVVMDGTIPPRIQEMLGGMLDPAQGDVEALVRALPQHISGSYLRAEWTAARAAGSATSGNHGHSGRPGEVGGSGPSVAAQVEEAEQIINDAKTSGQPVLFHSGDAGIDEQLAGGIEPTFGAWQEEVLSGATDDEEAMRLIREQDPAAFFSEEPDWVIAKTARAMGDKALDEVTIEDIRQHGQLSIIRVAAREPNDSKMTEKESEAAWKKYEASQPGEEPNNFMQANENQEATYFGSTKRALFGDLPFGVEPGDIFSMTTVVPEMTLTGDALVKFMLKNFPQHMPKAKI